MSALPDFPDFSGLGPGKAKRPAKTAPSGDALERLNSYADCIRAVGEASDGQRNDCLNQVAYIIGKMANSKTAQESEILKDLLTACSKNGSLDEDGEAKCLDTIQRGLAAGRKVRDDSLKGLLALLERPLADMRNSTSRLICTPASACGQDARAPYLFKAFIAAGDLVCIFGAPGAGKSVLAPYLAFLLSQGASAFDLMARRSVVLYLAPEDARGMKTRIVALIKRHGSTASLFVVEGLTDLGAEDGAQLQEVVALIKTHRPRLVVLDTLAMGFPGFDENSSEAMSKVVRISRALANIGPAIVLIHHDTKAGGGTPRGHSILNGALDVALHLKTADSQGVVRGTLTKNRNGPCTLSLAFQIESEKIGLDEDGDAVTAPVLVEVSGNRVAAAVRPSRSEKAALDELTGLMPAHWLADDPVPHVALSVWRKVCVDGSLVSGAESRESRAKAFNRALTGLCQKGRIISDGDTVRIPPAEGLLTR
ncbi:AAA family ATPase [Hyphomonas sp.]|uniref:AAA family ATPase n=1 Tax=Hyphomonas sp. TaxID=87 RepID=UPI0030F8D559